MGDVDVAATDHLLTTTRSVRKRLDLARPVPLELVLECLDVAVQAPTGGNSQGWHFVLVDDPGRKQALAELYRRGFERYRDIPEVPRYGPDDPRAARFPQFLSSAAFLNRHLHEVPLLVVVCVDGRWEHLSVFHQSAAYGSVYPAVWSFQLALRARGLGSAITTMHLQFEEEAAALLGVPPDVTQVCLLPVGYIVGEGFRPAQRVPAATLTRHNIWSQPLT